MGKARMPAISSLIPPVLLPLKIPYMRNVLNWGRSHLCLQTWTQTEPPNWRSSQRQIPHREHFQGCDLAEEQHWSHSSSFYCCAQAEQSSYVTVCFCTNRDVLRLLSGVSLPLIPRMKLGQDLKKWAIPFDIWKNWSSEAQCSAPGSWGWLM